MILPFACGCLRAFLGAAFLALGLRAEILEGLATDGKAPLAGVRVYPDRLRKVNPAQVPVTVTGEDGRFRLEVAAEDAVLVVEKEGWQRDLVPRTDWGQPITLRPAPRFRTEPVLVVRVEVPGVPARLGDEELRGFLFGTEPGRASASTYLYEISKGELLLREGRFLHVPWSKGGLPTESMKQAITRQVLKSIRGLDLQELDRVDNRTGAPKPDGKPDHLWVFVPGPPGSVTAVPEHVHASCFLMPLPWDRRQRWPVVFLSEEVPLGNIVHEAFHAMGEHRVDDLYKDCNDPGTAGIWDLMDAGQYRGWDSHHPGLGPWREDLGYSPSPPGPWVRTELWYRGWFRSTVPTLNLKSRSWTGWIAPLSRAAAADPQRVVFPDPRGTGRFWEFWVSRPWGFEAGRVGGRWGPGHSGLVVARVEPALLSRTKPKGPVRVLDAHPGTPEPPPPRFPCGRFELDDAAYNIGPGENPRGSAGPLTWEVLNQDGSGRLKVAIRWATSGGKR